MPLAFSILQECPKLNQSLFAIPPARISFWSRALNLAPKAPRRLRERRGGGCRKNRKLSQSLVDQTPDFILPQQGNHVALFPMGSLMDSAACLRFMEPAIFDAGGEFLEDSVPLFCLARRLSFISRATPSTRQRKG